MKMKCLVSALFAVSLCVSGLPATASAASSTISPSFFYDNLKNDGTWYNTTEYGDVWHPNVASQNPNWRPYTDGSWAATNQGWTWVSNEPFGWAVYHYGRWTHLKDIGWAWVPGTQWAPAWVSWRASQADLAATGSPQGPPANSSTPAPPPQGSQTATTSVGENYIGWAPLPPEAVWNPATGFNAGVDVAYGIDPEDYCFTDAAYFGYPSLLGVIFAPDLGYYCCDHTFNCTDYGRWGGRGIYAGGPAYDRVRGFSERNMPYYNLRRDASGRLARNEIRDGRFHSVNGNTLHMAGPRFRSLAANHGPIAANRPALPMAQVGRPGRSGKVDEATAQRVHEHIASQAHNLPAANVRGAADRGRAEAANVTRNRGFRGENRGFASESRGVSHRSFGGHRGFAGISRHFGGGHGFAGFHGGGHPAGRGGGHGGGGHGGHHR